MFFLALAFAFTSMFENVCSNAVAGGIDLAGLFTRYLDIRRGALLTFFAARYDGRTDIPTPTEV